MTSTFFVAFPASARLQGNLRRFLDEVEAEPSVSHLHQLEAIGEDFVADLLTSFFEAPMAAVGAQGSVASMIQSGVKVINKAARALLRNLLSKATLEDQARLAACFRAMVLEQDGHMALAFPLDNANGARLQAAYAAFLDGQSGQTPALVDGMKAICDGALVHYLDGIVGCVKLNAFNRGMVATARATIRKAGMMAIEKGLPAMTREQKGPVVQHFQGLLVTG
ncbi:hypothetical protein [Isoalcanivorax indicus]|uniref:hypothetical protein n=1 Tax=Isoalcanivorax indicus TaxID=2202653 RepID=UPI000DBAD126|nr:hypothetical protein [Isoalcanivorax indicus]